jgi:hypothetical protein
MKITMWHKFIKGELYVDLNSKEEIDDFLNQCADRGLCWASGDKANQGVVPKYFQDRLLVTYGRWSPFNNEMVLMYVAGKPSKNKQIIKWSDYMKRKNFTKADFESGMVVECRNGERFLVLRDKLLDGAHWKNIDNYTTEMKECVKGTYPYDIMKVYDTIGVTNLHNIFSDENLILIWERQEVEEMTLEEVCKLLGKEIKIVK